MSRPVGIVNGALAVGSGDEAGTLVGQEARGVAADGAEALHGDPGALELHAGELLRDLGRDGQAEPGRADLIERDAADLARQSDRRGRSRP